MVTENLSKLRVINRSHSTSIAQPKKFNFTRERIDSLRLPTNGQRSYYYDSKIRGLAIAVTPQGKRSFVLYRWVAGRPERITIGAYTDLSIEQARKRAEQLNADIAMGENPAATRRRIRDEDTLQELFQTFLTLYAKENKRRWRDDETMFRTHLQAWRFRKISSIAKVDVIKLHAHIGRTRGRYIANRVIELLCAMFNRARNDWGWTGTNPAAGIKAFKEKKRDRFLDGNELPAFFKALAVELNEVMQHYFLIALLTGARRRNVESMRWDELDWPRQTWIIPAEKAKAGENLAIVLTPEVVQILERRKACSKGPWVFPGKGRTGHLVEPKSAWRRILKRAGLTNLRIHDLRRSLGSWMAASGASLLVIGKGLGHTSTEATRVYARLNLDPVREAVSRATQAMLLAGGVAGLLEGK